MPARLFLHAFEGAAYEHRHLGLGGTGDHVLQELLVSRGVDDDVVARLCGEERLRGVYRDSPLPLLPQVVHEEAELQLPALLLRGPANLLQPALWQRVGVVEQPADEGGLAVVYRAHKNQLQGFPVHRFLGGY